MARLRLGVPSCGERTAGANRGNPPGLTLRTWPENFRQPTSTFPDGNQGEHIPGKRLQPARDCCAAVFRQPLPRTGDMRGGQRIVAIQF